MTMHEASRTLVKSTPELWAECSDGESLSRHLGAFGEIRITKLEPETAVAWEGDDVSGTVTLEPSGWGTRVVLTAMSDGAGVTAPMEPPAAGEPCAEPPALVKPDPEPEVGVTEPAAAELRTAESEPEPDHTGFFARLFGFMRRPPVEPSSSPSGEAATPVIAAASESGSQTEIAATDTRGSTAVGALETERDATAEMPETEDSTAAPAFGVLVGALESLGAAHKRPFSRS